MEEVNGDKGGVGGWGKGEDGGRVKVVSGGKW